MIEKQLSLAPHLSSASTAPPNVPILPSLSVKSGGNLRPLSAKVIQPVAARAASVRKNHLRGPATTPAPGGYTVVRYTEERKQEWDKFVSAAKNATFLFARDYMDYHRDRFTDHSLLIFRDEVLVAVLPANLNADGSLISHEGLTYGGLVVSRGATLSEVLEFFHVLLRDLSRRKIGILRYKQIPGFYNTLPDEDGAYVLFLLEARLYRRDCAAVVVQGDRLPYRKGHQSLIKKAIQLGVQIVEEITFQPFLERVLAPRLAARYGTKPVHTLAELTQLAAHFPEQIRQFSAYCDDEILAGTTIYETPTVAHAQYGAVTDKGRQMGAQAYLFSTLIDQYQGKRFFDFGISNENEGRVLNHGLLDWKEGFGARCYAHDFYEITTESYRKLEPLLRSRPGKVVPLPHPVPVPAAGPGHRSPQTDFADPDAEIDGGELLCRHQLVAGAAAGC
jgi:hypothetical protein